MPESQSTPKRSFLDEYKLLCHKHGFIVEACGCCESPWIEEATAKELDKHTQHLLERID